MDLTTLARVKIQLEMVGDDGDDAWLNQIIPNASAAVERYMNRHAEATTYVKSFFPERGELVFPLQGVPITSITSVVYEGDTVAADDYTTDDALGLLRLKYELAYTTQGELVVTYIGGLAVDVAAIISNYVDVAYATDLYVAQLFQRRKQLSGISLSDAGGSVSYEDPVKFSIGVRELLNPYRLLDI